MNCATHPDQAAVAYCRSCGQAVCTVCQRPAQGTVFCPEHVPAGAAGTAAAPSAQPDAPPPPPPYGNPYVAPVPPPAAGRFAPSPGLAFLLGFIPGVGAIYNGQYAKGLVHAVIFGLLVSIHSSDSAGELEPLVGLMTMLFFFYQAFEAYHTAQRRLRGEPVDEFSSILPLHPSGSAQSRFPVGPVAIIAVGVLFLLNTLEVMRLREVLRFWPIGLILLGSWMLFVRLKAGREAARE